MDPEVVSRLRAMRVEEWAEPAVRYESACVDVLGPGAFGPSTIATVPAMSLLDALRLATHVKGRAMVLVNDADGRSCPFANFVDGERIDDVIPCPACGKAQRNADAAHCERCNADLG